MPQATTTLESRARTPHPSTLGSWRLVRRLGQGEWNEVFQASPIDACQTARADYAIKVLKTDCAQDVQAISLLQRESFIGKCVAHPHLQSILWSHVDRAPYYLVMPYQDGATLRALIEGDDRLNLARSLWIVRQTAEALAALHEQGWLHRDVKPDNIYVAANGHVTLCDLGLARRIDDVSTLETNVAGTPAYMPPEAFCESFDMSPSSDTYSLGVTFFEMLAGVRPFPHRDPAELGAAHRLLKPPDLRSHCPHLPSPVVRLVRNMLAKEPLRRPTGRELVEQLVDLEIDFFGEW